MKPGIFHNLLFKKGKIQFLIGKMNDRQLRKFEVKDIEGIRNAVGKAQAVISGKFILK